MVLESSHQSHGNMSAHKKFQLKAQNKWLAVDPYMPPRRSGMHNYQHQEYKRQAREGRVMVWSIDFFFSKLSNAIATKNLSCNMQRKLVCLHTWLQLHSRLGGEKFVKNIALPPASELALLSDISKLDCGTKSQ